MYHNDHSTNRLHEIGADLLLGIWLWGQTRVLCRGLAINCLNTIVVMGPHTTGLVANDAPRDLSRALRGVACLNVSVAVIGADIPHCPDACRGDAQVAGRDRLGPCRGATGHVARQNGMAIRVDEPPSQWLPQTIDQHLGIQRATGNAVVFRMRAGRPGPGRPGHEGNRRQPQTYSAHAESHARVV